MARDTWNDEHDLPEKVVRDIRVKDIVMNSTITTAMGTAFYLLQKAYFNDFVGRAVQKLAVILSLLNSN